MRERFPRISIDFFDAPPDPLLTHHHRTVPPSTAPPAGAPPAED
ncbi:hypothetical protein ABIA32_006075 [Streptacidiphilus sp. MAP12-20]